MSMASRSPVFSVVIPVHNRAGVVHAALASVQEQTFKDFECLVIDDGSTDGDLLVEVVAGLADERFRYVRQENGGASSARNRGIDLASGRYIALLDSDDRFLRHKLEACAAILEQCSGDVLLYSQMVVERGLKRTWVRPQRGPLPTERVDEYILTTAGTIRTSTIVLTAALARRVRFDVALPWFQDSDMAIRAANAGAVVRFVREPLVVLEDGVDDTRVSRSGDYATLLAYFKAMRSAGAISERAYWAARGWPCARAASSSNRPYAILLFTQATLHGAFPGRHAAIVAAQVILPYRTYQKIANGVVRLRGDLRGDPGTRSEPDVGVKWVQIAPLGISVSPMTTAEVAKVAATKHSDKRLLLNHNLHSAYLHNTDAAFRQLYEEWADWTIIDGAPILWLASLCSRSRLTRRQRTASTDWMSALPREGGSRRLFVFGAVAKSNEQAVDMLQQQLPDWTVAGVDGYVDDDVAVTLISDFAPDLVVVGLGMPRQEHFLYGNLSRLPPATYATVGGAIDYMAGAKRLAPRWLGTLGIEWVWRLIFDPRRLAYRYLVEPLLLVYRVVLRCLRQPPSGR